MLINVLILILLLHAAFRGYFHGFLLSAASLLGFIIATIAASAGYGKLAGVIAGITNLPVSFAGLISFLLIWVVVEVTYYALARRHLDKTGLLQTKPGLISQVSGAAINTVQMLVLLTIGLMIVVGLPLGSAVKNEISNAGLAKAMLDASSSYQKTVNRLVGESINDTLNFLTVKPQSNESLELGFTTTKVSVDEKSEQAMLDLVNRERAKLGLKQLTIDPELREVAREHSRDMFARGYFSHITPDGVDPFERMRRGGVEFRVAGENLALAPTVELAHDGLMNSPSHRDNILEKDFGQVGIGVIDGGIYGKMFTQNFTD